jgi:hypothetical protein
MANIELRFICRVENSDYIKIGSDEKDIVLTLRIGDTVSEIVFDKSTAIKFAKTLRTEINKINS